MLFVSVGRSELTPYPPPSPHTQTYQTGGNSTCSFWDQTIDGYYGGWSSRGCKKVTSSNGGKNNVVCECNHLTSFGLLVDTSPRPLVGDSTIGPYTSLGPVILIILLLLVIFSYLISG